MKALRHSIMIGLTTFALLPAWAADDPVIKKDLAQLQGEWSMVSGVADGMEMPEAMRQTAQRVCKGEETTVMVGGQLIMKAKFTLDPAKKPKAIDYDVLDGPTKGMKHLGIYEFEGETVKFCFAAPGGERPMEFVSKSGDRRTTSVWKRAKDAAAEPAKK
jgi:uncharacterized protein (TIGR03067 family)